MDGNGPTDTHTDTDYFSTWLHFNLFKDQAWELEKVVGEY